MTNGGNESDDSGVNTGGSDRPDGRASVDDLGDEVDGDTPSISVGSDEAAGDGPSLGGEDDGPSLDDVVFAETPSGDDADEASRGLFDDLLSGAPIFENKEVLRPSYTPHKLPHREEQINNMATILVTALRGDTPSNILIYGKTGTGKTASAKFVSEELETTSQKYEVPCTVEYINCEVTDTQYRVLAQLANKFIDQNREYIDDRIDELDGLRERAREDDAVLGESDLDVE